MWPITQLTGYVPKTTFWQDFTVAEKLGELEIKDTFDKSFSYWKDDVEYITELVMVLNWKMWQHAEGGNDKMAKLYRKLWEKADGWCMDNLKGDDLSHFLEETD